MSIFRELKEALEGRRRHPNDLTVLAAEVRGLAAVGRAGADVEVLMVDDAQMRRLNRIWRGDGRRTDVLAFPLEIPKTRGRLLGQVVVSAETAARKAKAKNLDGVLNAYAETFARHGAPVFASRDWHPARTRHFQADGGAWPPHCVQGTPGAAFHSRLALPAGTEVISKGMDPAADAYSCFQGETEDGMPFAAALGERGITRLFVGGLATDYCVKATVLDARKNGFPTVVIRDAIRAVDVKPGDGERALAEMKKAGATVADSKDLVV